MDQQYSLSSYNYISSYNYFSMLQDLVSLLLLAKLQAKTECKSFCTDVLVKLGKFFRSQIRGTETYLQTRLHGSLLHVKQNFFFAQKKTFLFFPFTNHLHPLTTCISCLVFCICSRWGFIFYLYSMWIEPLEELKNSLGYEVFCEADPES